MAMQPPIHATCHMVSAGHHLATQAGYEILEAGGNAVDAGVAAGIALGVVHSDMVQFAGVAPIMIYLAEEERVVTVSGLGWWPRAASLDRFVSEFGGHVPTGLLRTVVPAAPDAWILALRRYGTMGFGDVAAAAIRYAREGFPMHHVMLEYLTAHEGDYRRWPANEAIYLPGGRPPKEGERFVQTDLAASIQYMADEEAAAAARGGREAGLTAARDAFYRGDLARAMVRHHEENGGWLTMEDLAEYESAIEEPVVARLGEVEVYTCGPWCQGPVFAQMVSLLDGIDLAALGHNRADYIHTITEVMKLSFADRERHYGDPRFVAVALDRLLSAGYARERRALIRPDRRGPACLRRGSRTMAPAARRSHSRSAPSPSPIPRPPPPTPPTARRWTATAIASRRPRATSRGSLRSSPAPASAPRRAARSRGAAPGHASCVAPGKRPRLTPNPAFARWPGRRVMPFRHPGRRRADPGDAPGAPQRRPVRDEHPGRGGGPPGSRPTASRTRSSPTTTCRGGSPSKGGCRKTVTRDLAARGHDVERLDDYSHRTAGVCAIQLDLETGIMEGGGGPEADEPRDGAVRNLPPELRPKVERRGA